MDQRDYIDEQGIEYLVMRREFITFLFVRFRKQFFSTTTNTAMKTWESSSPCNRKMIVIVSQNIKVYHEIKKTNN